MTIDRRTLLKAAAATVPAAARLPAGGGVARAQGAANTIKIGVLNDQSGLYRDISGPTSVACVRQAVQDFGNRGTSMSRSISADHQNRPDVGSNSRGSGSTATAWTWSWTCRPPPSRSR